MTPVVVPAAVGENVAEEHVEVTAQPRLQGGGTFPASFAQDRLWLLEQWQPGSVAHHEADVIRLLGPLDRDALIRSVTELERRHEPLRTTFSDNEDGRVEQRVAPPVDRINVGWREADTSTLPELIRTELEQPFDLRGGPLTRATLVRLGPFEHVLLLLRHRIIGDALSGEVLFNDLVALYGAAASGRPASLPPLAVQYADVAVWERQRLQGAEFEAQLAAWTERLQGAPPVLELPADHPRRQIPSFRSRRYRRDLPPGTCTALETLSRTVDAPLFVTVLAGFVALLARYTGQTDLVVGVAGRDRTPSGSEGLVGPFINPAVLRTDVSDDPSFRVLVTRVRDFMQAARAHRHLPFARVVDALHPARSLSYSPVFQVLVVQPQAPAPAAIAGGLTFAHLDVDRGASEHDLTFTFVETSDARSCVFDYNTDLFEEATIARLGQHLVTLLDGIVDQSAEVPVSRLPLLTSTERHQLLVEWNATATDYPSESFSELFEAQVARTPEAVAVALGAEQLTYRDLNARANQLARHLQRLGVGPDVLVGVCLDRSVQMLVALLATLKAGGAYVPLDPQYPADRLAFMIRDADLHVLLTEERLQASLPGHAVQIVLLDRHTEVLARESTDNPAPTGGPEHLAYVIYTSGSTGTPKGVLITRRALVSHCAAVSTHYGLEASDRILQFASISFDVAAEEIFPPWLSGATVVVRAGQAPPSIPELLQLASDTRLTILNLPASYWHQWVLELDRPSVTWPSDLRLVIVGNEKVFPERLATWKEVVGSRVRWMNAYGPTEATITATLYEPDLRRELPDASSVPIGRPINNKQAFVLDRHLEPVPIGVAGELYIGGEGLARGYLRRPELTRERFVPSPFINEGEGRLYRTGDRARYRADGQLEFLGRLDNQVKVRGFRVELEEIEAVLRGHPDVDDAAVVAHEAAGDTRLVGYVVTRAEAAPSPADLRPFLKQQLPDYMVPASFVALESFPMTPNGKVDRRALPATTGRDQARTVGVLPPRTAVEESVAAIWRELLHLEQVSVHDNFFELGGHSLLGVRLFTRLEEAFHTRLPLATLLEAPTIAQLAALLGQSEWQPSWSSVVPIQTTGTRRPFFCTHGAGAHVLSLRLLAKHLGDDQPFYGLQSQGLDGTTAPYRRVEDMAAHYIREIRTVQPEGPYMLGGFSFGGVVVFEMAQQLAAQGERVEPLILIDTFCPGVWDSYPPPTRFESIVYPLVVRVERQVVAWTQRGPIGYAKMWLAYLREGVQRRIARAAKRVSSRASLEGWDAPESLKQVIAANVEADRAYLPQPYPGRIVLFWASGESLGYRDYRMAWSEVAEALEVHVIPGDHNSLRQEPHVQVLAAKLKRCLEKHAVAERSACHSLARTGSR